MVDHREISQRVYICSLLATFTATEPTAPGYPPQQPYPQQQPPYPQQQAPYPTQQQPPYPAQGYAYGPPAYPPQDYGKGPALTSKSIQEFVCVFMYVHNIMCFG